MSEIKPGKRYFSVVYVVTSPEAFQATASFASAQMSNEAVSHGAKVTACGWGDYATERDAFADALTEQGIDTEEVVANYIAIELAEVGSFPEGIDFKNAVRDITG